MNDIVDLTEGFPEPFDLPCCPICDDQIFEYQEFATFRAWECVFLGHVECVYEMRMKLKK